MGSDSLSDPREELRSALEKFCAAQLPAERTQELYKLVDGQDLTFGLAALLLRRLELPAPVEGPGATAVHRVGPSVTSSRTAPAMPFMAWIRKKGPRPVSAADVQGLKHDKTIDLLMDENNHLFLNGKDKTGAFKKKLRAYSMITWYLQHRASVAFEDAFRKWASLSRRRQRKSADSYIMEEDDIGNFMRALRHFNDVAESAGLRKPLFDVVRGDDRIALTTIEELSICVIRGRD